MRRSEDREANEGRHPRGGERYWLAVDGMPGRGRLIRVGHVSRGLVRYVGNDLPWWYVPFVLRCTGDIGTGASAGVDDVRPYQAAESLALVRRAGVFHCLKVPLYTE